MASFRILARGGAGEGIGGLPPAWVRPEISLRNGAQRWFHGVGAGTGEKRGCSGETYRGIPSHPRDSTGSGSSLKFGGAKRLETRDLYFWIGGQECRFEARRGRKNGEAPAFALIMAQPGRDGARRHLFAND